MQIQQVNSNTTHQMLKGAGSSVIEIHSPEQFEQELKNSQVPIVVDFYATWCGPCRMIAPIYQELAQNYDGQVKFLKVNVDEVHSLLDKYNVRAMPTFLFFDQNGNLTERLVGANIAMLQENLRNLVYPT